MIARIWTGSVRRADGDAYADYMRGTGVVDYAKTPGNGGVWMLRRDVDDRTEFVMFTLWDSLDAIKAFAGEDYEAAVFYPEDGRFLIERDLRTAPLRSRRRLDALAVIGRSSAPERKGPNPQSVGPAVADVLRHHKCRGGGI